MKHIEYKRIFLAVGLVVLAFACRERDGSFEAHHYGDDKPIFDSNRINERTDADERLSTKRRKEVNIDSTEISKPANSKDETQVEYVLHLTEIILGSSNKDDADFDISIQLSVITDSKAESLGMRYLGNFKTKEMRKNIDNESFDVELETDNLNTDAEILLTVFKAKADGTNDSTKLADLKIDLRKLEDQKKKLQIHLTSNADFAGINLTDLNKSEYKDIGEDFQIKMVLDKRTRLIIKDELGSLSNSLVCLGKEKKKDEMFQLQMDENLLTLARNLETKSEASDLYDKTDKTYDSYIYAKHGITDSKVDTVVAYRSKDDRDAIEVRLEQLDSKEKKDCKFKNLSSSNLVKADILKSNGERLEACCTDFKLDTSKHQRELK